MLVPEATLTTHPDPSTTSAAATSAATTSAAATSAAATSATATPATATPATSNPATATSRLTMLPTDLQFKIIAQLPSIDLVRYELTAKSSSAPLEPELRELWRRRRTEYQALVCIQGEGEEPPAFGAPKAVSNALRSAAYEKAYFGRLWAAVHRSCPRCGKQASQGESGEGQLKMIHMTAGKYMHLCDWLIRPSDSARS